jgi:hypothetical protein
MLPPLVFPGSAVDAPLVSISVRSLLFFRRKLRLHLPRQRPLRHGRPDDPHVLDDPEALSCSSGLRPLLVLLQRLNHPHLWDPKNG